MVRGDRRQRRITRAAGDGVRWDSGVLQGGEVTSAFDPMIAKLIIRGADRNDAIVKADKALKETVLLGCKTNTAFLRRLLAHPASVAGDGQLGRAACRERGFQYGKILVVSAKLNK